MPPADRDDRPTSSQLDEHMALIEKGQQLAGHQPTAEDLDRARRILTGELSPEDARVEIEESLARLVERARAGGRA